MTFAELRFGRNQYNFDRTETFQRSFTEKTELLSYERKNMSELFHRTFLELKTWENFMQEPE